MHEFSQNEAVLWTDRKRWLGMPLTFTKYTVDNERLYVKTGFFKTEVNELLLYRVLDIKSSRTLGQKIFGVGSIMLHTADKSEENLIIKNIKKSEKVRTFLSRIVEQRRIEKGITGRELYGAASAEHIGEGFADLDGDGIPD